jgi:hypothetical protein
VNWKEEDQQAVQKEVERTKAQGFLSRNLRELFVVRKRTVFSLVKT